MSNPMRVVKVMTAKTQRDEDCVTALEQMLKLATEGKIHRMVCVCLNDTTGDTFRIKHHTRSASLIGAMSCTLAGMQQEWDGH